MRETITIVICLFLFLLSLQMGYIRTKTEYDALKAQVRNFQETNDQLGEQVEQLARENSAGGQNTALSELRAELSRYREAEGDKLERLRQAKNELKRALRREFEAGEIELLDRNGWLTLRAQDGLFFDRPDAVQLNKSGRSLVGKIGGILGEMKDLEIQIAAYMDRDPNGGESSSELRKRSLDRARAITDQLQSSGDVDPVQLAAVGYGADRPLAPNDTAFNRVQNRLLEFRLLPISESRLDEARRIVRIERQIEPSRGTKGALKAPSSRGVRSIGEEALENFDDQKFDAGYEKPAE